jgi:predicted  nucleic acid-binding Zn-ribbon protein
MRWGLKNNSEKLEELRKTLEEVQVNVKQLEVRLNEANARIDGLVGKSDPDLDRKREASES